MFHNKFYPELTEECIEWYLHHTHALSM